MSVEPSIDWMWGSDKDANKGPSNALHMAYVVRAFPPVVRGDASSRQCVVNAIRAERAGDRDLAINWLKAGQAHNGAAQDELERLRNDAITYMLNAYGSRVQ